MTLFTSKLEATGRKGGKGNVPGPGPLLHMLFVRDPSSDHFTIEREALTRLRGSEAPSNSLRVTA